MSSNWRSLSIVVYTGFPWLFMVIPIMEVYVESSLLDWVSRDGGLLLLKGVGFYYFLMADSASLAAFF